MYIKIENTVFIKNYYSISKYRVIIVKIKIKLKIKNF